MVARGMNMSIGSPPQALAFMPMMPLNNTLLYGTDGYCLTGSPGVGPWTDTACTTFRGGSYDPLASTSKATISTNAYPYDGAPDPVLGGTRYPQVQHVSDSLHLNSNITLDGFPLGVAQSDWGEQAYTPMMGIGLGTNSTLLNFLVSTGQIGSRSWSYFWGRTVVPGFSSSTSQQIDGSVVFGGYDKAKVTGNKFTQPMTTTESGCPSQMVVNIADIVLNFANGSDASIFPISSSTAIAACLTPALPTLMWMPFDPYFDKMMNLTSNNIYKMGRSVGVYYWNMRYEATGFEPYDGDLTIRLQSGFSVRIPNDQLVRPHTSIDQTTGAVVVNTTAPDLLIDSLQQVQATQLAQLGFQFFSSAYLHVNQDSHEFTLWEANPTMAEDLVAVDETGQEITKFCAASAVNSTGGTAVNNEKPAPISAGVIAGSAIGAVAIIGLVAGFVFWWLRRRRLWRAQAAENLKMTDFRSNRGQRSISMGNSPSSAYGSAYGSSATYYKTELDGHDKRTPPSQTLHEIYTKRDSEMYRKRESVEKYYTVKYDKYDTAAPAYEVRHELQG
ncbi:hypothetical protein Sste5346_008862 [Sporothrix stenoceras]|uniref:Peptidase A1 domain-containing protein n=1 Tax=Sporothrix stenoceras TaxID=5173 RepID=A0ABR3YMW4_9PEZI